VPSFLLLRAKPQKKNKKKDPHPTFSRKREKAKSLSQRLWAFDGMTRKVFMSEELLDCRPANAALTCGNG
jgi:hypothetical protein